MDKRGDYQDFPSKFFVPQPRKLSQGNPFVLCFRKLPVSKKNMHRRGRGFEKFLSKKLLSQSAEKFGRGKHLCCVSENFWQRKRLRIRGEVSRFPVENFLSNFAELFRRGTLLCCVSESFWLRESLWIRRGLSRSSVESFFV